MSEAIPATTNGLDFIQQQHIATPRGDYIHAEYISRAHRGNDLLAVVTMGGRPVEARGEVQRVGNVPPERRYAIGPVENGRAELLSQLEFEREHAQHYVDAYAQVKDARLDKVELRHIPNVKEYVSVKVHPNDPKRLLPLGMAPEGAGPPSAPPDTFWSETLGREVSAAEVVAMKNAPDPRDAKMRELEATIAALQAKMAEPDPVEAKAEFKPAKPAKPLLSAPCGKQMVTGLPMHLKHCKKPECAEARAPKE